MPAKAERKTVSSGARSGALDLLEEEEEAEGPGTGAGAAGGAGSVDISLLAAAAAAAAAASALAWSSISMELVGGGVGGARTDMMVGDKGC